MAQFYQERLKRHLKQMNRYLRYVLNDHFLLVLLFLAGGLGFYYSELIKGLPLGVSWGVPVVLGIWFASLFVGRVATLVEAPDTVFLLPKEPEMKGYLQKALNYSWLLPMVVLAAVVGVSMPLVVIATKTSFQSFFWYVALMWLLKRSQLVVQMVSFFQETRVIQKQLLGVWGVSSGGLLALSLIWQPWWALVGAVLQVGGLTYWLVRIQQQYGLDWEKLVRLEQARQQKIYGFINLFTDVPGIVTPVKRRRYLDFLLKPIQKRGANTFLYLYARSFLRGNTYSGLYVRLACIGSLVLAFLDQFWLNAGLAAIFVYLIGFQLIPLYTQFDYVSATQLYPLTIAQKQASLQRLLLVLLAIISVLFAGMAGIGLQDIGQALLLLGLLALETVLLVYGYVPQRLKKINT